MIDGPAHPQADPAHQRLHSRPASATCCRSSGRRTTSSPTSSAPCRSATGRSRSGWSGTCSWPRTSWASASARASASPPTTSATCAPLRDADADRRRSWQRAANLGKNGPRDVAGKVMTHCVPNERVRWRDGRSWAGLRGAGRCRGCLAAASRRQRRSPARPLRRHTVAERTGPARHLAPQPELHAVLAAEAAPAPCSDRRRRGARCSGSSVVVTQRGTGSAPRSTASPDGDLAAGPAVLLPRGGAVDRDVHAEAARRRGRRRRARAPGRRRSPRTSARRRSRRAPSRRRRARAGARRRPRCSETAAASGPSTSRPSIRRPGVVARARAARRARPPASTVAAVREAQRQDVRRGVPARERSAAARARAPSRPAAPSASSDEERAVAVARRAGRARARRRASPASP